MKHFADELVDSVVMICILQIDSADYVLHFAADYNYIIIMDLPIFCQADRFLFDTNATPYSIWLASVVLSVTSVYVMVCKIQTLSVIIIYIPLSRL